MRRANTLGRCGDNGYADTVSVLRIYRLPDDSNPDDGVDYPWQVDGYNPDTDQCSGWVHNYRTFGEAVADLPTLYDEYITEPAKLDLLESEATL